jgi:hypothetical protein
MTCKTLFYSLLAAFGLTSAITCTTSPANASSARVGFSRVAWQERCQELKRSFAQQPELNLTYQSLPAKVAVQSSWQLLWLGKRVPIPVANYSQVIVNGSHQDRSVIMTGTHNGKLVRIVLSRHVDAPIEDIFATAEQGASDEGKAITKQLFGGSVRLSKLWDLGFRHTPANLSCSTARWQQEVPIAIALTLKGVGLPQGSDLAVYAIGRGQANFSITSDTEVWRVDWVEGTSGGQVYMRLPKGHAYGQLGLGVEQKAWQVAQGQPRWLNALETAIANPERSNWLALATELKRAGMSAKSVKSVEAIADKATTMLRPSHLRSQQF